MLDRSKDVKWMQVEHRIHANILNVEYFTRQFTSTLNVLTFNRVPFYCRQLIWITLNVASIESFTYLEYNNTLWNTTYNKIKNK